MKNSSPMLCFSILSPDSSLNTKNLVASVLDAMRHEPTFINTVLHRDPADPTRLMLYETWLDRDDFFQVQLKRDYRRT